MEAAGQKRRRLIRPLPLGRYKLRPASVSLVLLLGCVGFGLGASVRLALGGDHLADRVASRVADHSRGSFIKKQIATARGVLDAEEAQMRSDGIIKGLLVLCALLLLAIAVAEVLRLFALERKEEDRAS